MDYHRSGEGKWVISSAKKNMKSAEDNPQVVRDYLEAELRRGVVLGPFQREQLSLVHVSRFGVIAKSSQPGKWRLIVDLSFPEGKSVNDGISSELCSFRYVKVDDVARKVCHLGPGTLMSKIYIKSAYRIVLVHPQDRHLFGMQWDGKLYVHTALPFGLRSAPKIFNAIADALEWIVRQHGVDYLWHYLDDFITCGQAGSDECRVNLNLLTDLCKHLGVPLAEEKVEGPTTSIVFSGILINSVWGELRLPPEKLARLRSQIREWLQKKRCRKKKLLSIAGQFQHAASVVWPGRTFLRRLFDLSATVAKPTHHVSLNKAARSDLMWWNEFLSDWNRVLLLSSAGEQEPTVVLTSDASGSCGCGAYWDSQWFQLPWASTSCPAGFNIAVKELIPIVIAAALWVKHWMGQVVCSRCDNEAVVAVINKRTSRDVDLMHLLRCLAFFEARSSFRMVATHIARSQNVLADDLSRDRLSSFLSKVEHMPFTAQSVPPQPLLDMLINHKPDWISQAWRDLFRRTLNTV